jgi:hypothetical protein
MSEGPPERIPHPGDSAISRTTLAVRHNLAPSEPAPAAAGGLAAREHVRRTPMLAGSPGRVRAIELGRDSECDARSARL